MTTNAILVPDPISDEAIENLCLIGLSDGAPAASNDTAQLLDDCIGCGRHLPWPLPRPGLWAGAIACPECRRWYFAECRNDARPQVVTRHVDAPNRRLFRAQFDKLQADAIEMLFRRVLSDDAYVGQERRRETRQKLDAPVTVIPLGEDGRPTAPAVAQRTLDVSLTGVGLQGDAPPTSPLVVVDFSPAGAKAVQVIARVVWAELRHGVHKCGCQFLHSPSTPLPMK